MREEGFITADAVRGGARRSRSPSRRRRPATYLAAPWYVEHVRRLLEERYGGTAPYQLGLQVYTAVDLAHAARRRGGAARRASASSTAARASAARSATSTRGRSTPSSPARRADRARRGEPGARRGHASRAPQGLAVRTAWRARRPARRRARLGHDAASRPTRSSRATSSRSRSPATAPDGSARFALDQEPQVEGALVAIDPYTGQVKAMVGGYDFAPKPVQPRHAGAPPARLGVQAARLRGRDRPRLHARVDRARRADRARRTATSRRGRRTTTRTSTTARRRSARRSRARSTRVTVRLVDAHRHQDGASTTSRASASAARCRGTSRSRSAPPR